MYLHNPLRQSFNRFVLSILLLLPGWGFAQSVVINEFMASNSSTIADELGEYDDWVEFYNTGSTSIDMGGLYVSDDPTNPTKWQISANAPTATTIPAGGFLLFWLDGEPSQGPRHLDIKLSAAGEAILLTSSNGFSIIDQYSFGQQTADVSLGRSPNGAANWVLFDQPTPEASNDTPGGNDIADSPVASISGGVYTGSVQVSLSSATVGASIYYTLDGNTPTENSTPYTGTLTINTTTPLRAMATGAGLLASKTMTETYLIDVDHSFAIITINTNPEHFFDPDIGIFENIDIPFEYPAHMQFFETDGSLVISQDIEIEKHGAATLTQAQKALKLKAKAGFGNEFFNYPLFPDLPFDQYRSLVIRASGQDWKKSNFRDAMMQSLVGDVSDMNGMIDLPDLDLQGFRPSVVYLNGVYWGIYNLREQMNWKYLDTHYGLNDEEVDVIENFLEADDGDMEAWDDFFAFLENNDFSNGAAYESLREKADIDHYIDYALHGIYTDNNDWPGVNFKRWRERTPDSKWRWLTKDLDFGFGLRPLNAPWNSGDYTTDMIAHCLAEDSPVYFNPPHATLLLRSILENDGAKTYFFNRAADLLNSLFAADRVVGRIDDFETLFLPEIPQHMDRWNGGWNQNAQEVEILRTFANGRTDIMRDHMVNYFSEISGLTAVTLNAVPATGGDIHFSTLTLSENQYPWTGTYFRGIDIPVFAKAAPGYVLTGWSDASLGEEAEVSVQYNSSSASLTAYFDLGSTATDPIVINEINYNSPDFPNSGDWVELYNPNNGAVDISGWYLEDESGSHFGFPAGTQLAAGAYLVLAEDLLEFQSVFPSLQNIYGGFGVIPNGFKFSNNGELITLKNANGDLIDAVAYDDMAPWPVAPDGNGPTLQLIDPALDNTLASSWIHYPPTPGSVNGEVPSPQDQAINFPIIADQYDFAPPFDPGATATSGLPVSYSIVSGPATVAGSNIVLTGNVGIVVVEADQTGNADYYAAAPVQRSFEVKTFEGGPEGYCETEGVAPWQEWIAHISFGDIDHPSFKEQYADFTDQGTYVDQGGTYPLVITPDFSWLTYNEFYRAWIDFNQDSDFDDPGELVFSANDDGFGPIEGDIEIPPTATPGATRMRISMKRDAPPSPCEVFANGEVEDYTVIVVESNIGPELNLTCPDDISVTISGGSGSTSVNWTEPVATTTCPTGNPTTNLQTSIPNGGEFPVGTSIVVYEASDNCGNATTCSFTVTVMVDNGELSLSCPDDISVTISGGSGSTPVSWTEPVATTTCPTGNPTTSLQTSIPNGGEFPVGTSIVVYEASDNCGNATTCSFTVTVMVDNGELSLSCPDDISVTISGGSGSTPVSWTEPVATTTCPTGNPTTSLQTSIPNGGEFPVGTSIVVYEASDDCGNVTTCSFTVAVTVNNGMLSLDCPDDISLEVPPGTPGALVSWADPNPTSTCPIGNVLLEQTGGPLNGASFPVGNSVVAYTASDDCGNQMACTFTVLVEELPSTIEVNDCPDDLIVMVAGGETGAVANWDLPSATTDCLPGNIALTQTQGLPAGSYFDIGVYLIEYSFSDDCDGVSTCSFTLIVEDDSGTLLLDCPSDLEVVLPEGQATMAINWPLPDLSTTCQQGGTANSNCGTAISGFTLLGNHNDSEYHLSETPEKWAEAQEECALWDAYLVTIGDEEENEFLKNNLSVNAFIGLNDSETEGQLVWDSGEPISYLNFSANNQNTSSRDFTRIQYADGAWKMQSADFSSYFLMELNCPEGLLLTQISGPALGSSVGEGVYTIGYEATDGCGNTATCSFSVEVVAPDPPEGDYCESEGEEPWEQYIGHVSFHTIDHASGKDNYGDFTDESTTVEAGESYAFTLVPMFSFHHWDEYVRVWIDFNQDGDFEDSGELVLEEISLAGSPNYPPTQVQLISGDIAIPPDATLGANRMRVSMKKDAFAGPCEVFVYGEVEDYTVVIAENSIDFGVTSELLHFQAVKDGREVRLDWVTNTEFKNEFFLVEHTLNGVDYTTLAMVSSVSDMVEERAYHFVDKQPNKGTNYYRVRQVHYDSTYRHTPLRQVDFDLSLNSFEVFPVPASNEVFINIRHHLGSVADLNIFNGLGQPVWQEAVSEIGLDPIRIDVSRWGSGIYFLSVKIADKKAITRRFVVSN